MILKPKETTIAYRCPVCGKGVMSLVGVFSLSGDALKLKCQCGKSHMTMTYTSDRKLRLSVPCVACPNPHSFTVTSSLFFGDELFRLPCPFTGLDICFMGKTEDVMAALDESADILNNMLEEAGISSLEAFYKDGEDLHLSADDPMIDEILRFVIADLFEDGSVHCKCKEGDTPSYAYEFLPPEYEDVRVFCRTCGAETTRRITDHESAMEFLNCEDLRLE